MFRSLNIAAKSLIDLAICRISRSLAATTAVESSTKCNWFFEKACGDDREEITNWGNRNKSGMSGYRYLDILHSIYLSIYINLEDLLPHPLVYLQPIHRHLLLSGVFLFVLYVEVLN